MLRALKASRPLHLVFARVGSDFRRINNYFKWKNEHGKAQAEGNRCIKQTQHRC